MKDPHFQTREPNYRVVLFWDINQWSRSTFEHENGKQQRILTVIFESSLICKVTCDDFIKYLYPKVNKFRPTEN